MELRILEPQNQTQHKIEAMYEILECSQQGYLNKCPYMYTYASIHIFVYIYTYIIYRLCVFVSYMHDIFSVFYHCIVVLTYLHIYACKWIGTTKPHTYQCIHICIDRLPLQESLVLTRRALMASRRRQEDVAVAVRKLHEAGRQGLGGRALCCLESTWLERSLQRKSSCSKSLNSPKQVARTHTHICMNMYVDMHVHTPVYIHIHTQAHICMYKYIHTHSYSRGHNARIIHILEPQMVVAVPH